MLSPIETSFNRSVYGNKACNLSLCFQSKSKIYTVPNGFVLGARIYELFTRPCANFIQMLVARCDFENAAEVVGLHEQIAYEILNCSFPDRLAWKIANMLSDLKGPWVVRSSSPTEDQDNVSFAGVYNSYPNITSVEDVFNSIVKVYASLYDITAIQDRSFCGLPQLDLAMPVIIQEYIEGDISGVLFTRHADTSEDIMHLVANEGSCENIVNGTSRDYAEYLMKDFKTKALSDEALSIPVDTLNRLEILGKELEFRLKKPLDIEWTVRNKDIYLLQVRPITTLATYVPNEPSTNTRKPIVTGTAIRSLAVKKPIKGRATVIKKGHKPDFKPGDILVCDNTDIDLENYMKLSKGVITNHGVPNSHVAIRCREFNRPAIIGTLKATEHIKNHQMIELNLNESPYKGYVYNG